MYGQGSYNSQFGRGPPPPLQPPYRHQPPGPPPLPPHFQQGSLAPPPIFQRGLPIYQHSPPVPHPAVRQISPDAGANNSQTYVPPNPAAHGSTPLPHMCSTDQQKMQLSSHLGTQNVHHMPASMPPHPPRELPPPSATVYRASVQLQSQQPGGEQDLPYMLNQPPPPPTSSSFTSDPFGSVVQSTGRNSRMPSLVSLPPPPPPLLFNPPLIPSSRPPSTSPSSSSAHHEAASNLTSSSKPFCSKVSTSDCFDKDVITYQVRYNVHQFDGSLIQEGSPSPPKPTEEKVVQKIEDLCQLIAKNGPDYEDLVRQNESGNPEFEFLFAGDPGSDAEIAHEYFLWTKKKCMLACKLNEKRSESPLRTSGTDSSLQSNHLEVASRTYSPPDSDMEMEDDITLPGNDPGVNHSIEGTSGYDLIYSELDVKELSHKQQMTESKRAASTAPVILEQVDRVVSKHDLVALERPAAKVCSPVISSADECPLNRNLEKSATTSVDDKFSSGALAAAQGVYSEKKSSQLIEGGSPFRLLHDYASDDISDNDKEPHGASALKDTSSVAVGGSSPHRNIGLNISPKSVNFHEVSGREPEEIVMASITSGTTDENVLHKHKNQAYVGHAESPQDFQKKNALEDAGVEIRLNGNLQKEYAEKGAKSASNSLKVDEFGRLVREGASESDSDDSRYTGRQGKRGRSRSRSPLGRRRKGRLWRRRERRSRSRSWSPRKRRSRSRSPRNRRSSRSRSPRNRRSRSRSPVSKRVSSFCGDRMRRDRSQIPGCFDFRRGRCYRGASCRYLHHDSEKGDGSKRRRSKQQFMEVPPIPKDSNFEGEVKHNLQKESDQQHHVVKSSKMQLGQEMPGSFDQDSRLVDPHTVKSDTFKSHGDASPDILPRENSVTMPSQAKLHDPLLQNAECLPQQTDNSSISDSSPEQTPMNSVNKLPVSEALPNSIEFRHNSAQLPPPPPCSQGVTAHNMTQPPGDYNLVPESASFASQAASGERFRSNMIPSQQSNFFLPPIPSWTPLPPPPPIVSSQIRTYAAELPTPSQVGDFQQRSFHPMQEPNRSISCSEDFSSKPLPPYNLQSQQFTVQGLLREDQSSHLPTLGLRTSSSFPQGDNQLVPTTFSQELSASKLQPSPADNLHPGELLKSTSHIHLHLNQQQPPYSVHHSVSVSSSSKFPPDLQEVNQSSHPLNLEGSRNSTYYPHASTFEQSLSSKLSSDACRQEVTTYCGKYASPFDMSHARVEVRDTGSVGSRQATSSPNSPKAVGQNFPRSGGDQYDPLLDSFEPSSNLSYKTNNVNKWEPSSDSDIMLGHSGSNKPLDVEENNKKKATGGVVGVAATITAFNEEYGESADAEVGAVENESPNNPNGAGNLNSGEIEIDPIKSPSKSKNKESRSMKLFKVALADFVKEVLKPSWREGNMSKEAFKTIVKKTVDKVSGAMKSHQIPKSQAKIDQYIVSSQRKLTKLVMGYVDKYVKM